MGHTAYPCFSHNKGLSRMVSWFKRTAVTRYDEHLSVALRTTAKEHRGQGSQPLRSTLFCRITEQLRQAPAEKGLHHHQCHIEE